MATSPSRDGQHASISVGVCHYGPSALVGDVFFVTWLMSPMALWPSVGDEGKYGLILFIKILISWRTRGLKLAL